MLLYIVKRPSRFMTGLKKQKQGFRCYRMLVCVRCNTKKNSWNVMKKKGLKKLTHTDIDGKRDRGNWCMAYLTSLYNWTVAKGQNLLRATKDRKAMSWRGTAHRNVYYACLKITFNFSVIQYHKWNHLLIFNFDFVFIINQLLCPVAFKIMSNLKIFSQ